MRVLYCTRGDSPHDQRFLTALSQSGHEVYALRLQACTPQTPSGVTEVPWEGIPGPLKLSQVPALSARLAAPRRRFTHLVPMHEAPQT